MNQTKIIYNQTLYFRLLGLRQVKSLRGWYETIFEHGRQTKLSGYLYSYVYMIEPKYFQIIGNGYLCF